MRCGLGAVRNRVVRRSAQDLGFNNHTRAPNVAVPLNYGEIGFKRRSHNRWLIGIVVLTCPGFLDQ
jgi:hypothetical protein